MFDTNHTGLQRLGGNRFHIAALLFLGLVETAISLFYPWAVGRSVNDLMRGGYLALAVLVGIWLAHLAIASGRQLWETRPIPN